MKKRTISILLFLSVLLGACAETSTSGETTTADSTTSAPETMRGTLDPTLDFGGEKVVFIVDKDLPVSDFTAEQTGDIVDDALFLRSLDVQERLNVTFDFFWSPGNYANRKEFQGYVSSSVLANDAAYDIVGGYSVSIATLAANGHLCSIANVPHIDFTQPWWSKSLMDNISIDGNLYFVTGDISTNAIGSSFGVFFNKGLISTYKLENPYELVDSGKWTLDKMLSMTSEIYSDLNGNNTRDEGDMYGVVAAETSFDNLYYSVGMNCVEPDPELGMVVSPDFGSEKMVTLLEKLCDAFNHKAGNTFMAQDASYMPFLEENAVFLLIGMSAAATRLREADFEYGIVPTPKWDEKQKEYRSTHAYTSAFYGIPLDAKDAEMSAAVIEAMAIEGYYNLAPAYFETALKVKYSSDDDSARMFDIIRAGTTYDFGRVFSTAALSSIPGRMRGMVTTDNVNWMSTYESNITKFETLLAELVEKLRAGEA